MRRINKRGSFTEAIQWIVRILAASVLLLLLLGQITMLTGFVKKPNSMELSLYRARLINGPDGIFLEKDGHIIPGIIDLNKMTNRHLIEVYKQEEPLFAARLRLYDTAAAVGSETPFQEAMHYPQLIDTYLELGKAGLTGSGGALYEREVLPVLIETKNGRVPGWLEVEVMKRT